MDPVGKPSDGDGQDVPVLDRRLSRETWWATVPSPEDLVRLYDVIAWDRLVRSTHVREYYQDFRTSGLLIAHTLPYVLPIPSERALYRQLIERELLQDLCGFRPTSVRGRLFVPSRATLWHFRRKLGQRFGQLLLRALALLEIRGLSRGINLPFAEPIPAPDQPRTGPARDRFRFDDIRIEVRQGSIPRNRRFRDQRHAPYQYEMPLAGTSEPGGQSRKPYQDLPEDVRLPVDVFATTKSRERRSFAIRPPGWLLYQLPIEKEPLAEQGPAYLSRPYTACNVLLIRGLGDFREILLAKRLKGYGAGTFAAPGGKRIPGESVRACAARELEEETGLHMLDAAPVSLDVTHVEGKPIVRSIGVFCSHFTGELRQREPWSNGEWQWYSLNALPEDLFFPTQLALDAYRAGSGKWITWEDVSDDDLASAAPSLWDPPPSPSEE